LSALAECLCAEILNPVWGVPDVCTCGVVPGEVASAEQTGNCQTKCGQAWVRLVGLYPMAQIGTPQTEAGNCGAGLGMDVEVGIMRCITVGDGRGNPPTPEQYLAATQLQITDALIMRTAIECCPALPSRDTILGLYQPLGPEGGLVGGLWNLSSSADPI